MRGPARSGARFAAGPGNAKRIRRRVQQLGMIVVPLFEFRQILLVAVVRVGGEVERGGRELQLLAIELRGHRGSVFGHLQLYVAGSGRDDAFREVGDDLRVLAFPRDHVLGAFEFFQRSVVPVLIFDGSHDQGVNLLGAGRGIPSDDHTLAAGQRPRRWRAEPRRQCNQAHSQRHDVSSMDHAFAWRCRVWPGPPHCLESDSTADWAVVLACFRIATPRPCDRVNLNGTHYSLKRESAANMGTLES